MYYTIQLSKHVQVEVIMYLLLQGQNSARMIEKTNDGNRNIDTH